jgi:hypothetical protein
MWYTRKAVKSGFMTPLFAAGALAAAIAVAPVAAADVNTAGPAVASHFVSVSANQPDDPGGGPGGAGCAPDGQCGSGGVNGPGGGPGGSGCVPGLGCGFGGQNAGPGGIPGGSGCLPGVGCGFGHA